MRSFKNIYAAGSLNNCTTDSDKTGIWGQDSSSGIHNNAILSGSYLNVFGYETAIDAIHCGVDSFGNLGDCVTEIGFTSEFNLQYPPGEEVWEDGNCNLNSRIANKQPILIYNRDTSSCRYGP